jgi:hypothetical protein
LPVAHRNGDVWHDERQNRGQNEQRPDAIYRKQIDLQFLFRPMCIRYPEPAGQLLKRLRNKKENNADSGKAIAVLLLSISIADSPLLQYSTGYRPFCDTKI